MSLTSKHVIVSRNVFREVNSTCKCHQGMLFVECQQEQPSTRRSQELYFRLITTSKNNFTLTP